MSKKRRYRGVIEIDVFNLNVVVFDNDKDRLRVLADEGCVDLEPRDAGGIASAHLDSTASGSPRLSMVIDKTATKATWAHECVHIADFLMARLSLPMGLENTEIRAYLTGHVFSGLEKIFAKKGKRK